MGGTAGPRTVILLYHSIAERQHDRWQLAIPPSRFDEQIERIASRYRVVPLAQLVSERARGKLNHGTVCITFDDGYEDNLTAAVPVLRRHAVPATIFLSGEGAWEGSAFWWDDFEARARAAGLSDPVMGERHAQLMALEQGPRQSAISDLDPAVGEDLARVLPLSRWREIASEPLIELGAHGWSHRRLGGLTRREQETEVRRNIELIERYAGTRARLFAYPFGGPFDHVTIEVLRDCGLLAACAVQKAAVTASTSLFELPRLEVGSWKASGLELRIEEVFRG